MRRGMLLKGQNGHQCKCLVCRNKFVVGADTDQIFIPSTCGKSYCVNQQLSILYKRNPQIINKNYGAVDCTRHDIQKMQEILCSYAQDGMDVRVFADLIDALMLIALKIGKNINVKYILRDVSSEIVEQIELYLFQRAA